MKKILSFSFSILFAASLLAQGTIQGFTISPASPTVNDDVKVYVDLEFSSGACDVFQQSHFTNGSITDATALHCLGMLTVICNTTDTFDLGYLQAGQHTFRFSLNTGISGGTGGCTPGIVVDDTASTNFMVSPAAGIERQKDIYETITAYPNPFNTIAMLKISSLVSFKNAELKVFDSNGKTVKIVSDIHSNEILFKRDELQNGIYFYQLIEKNIIISSGKLVME